MLHVLFLHRLISCMHELCVPGSIVQGYIRLSIGITTTTGILMLGSMFTWTSFCVEMYAIMLLAMWSSVAKSYDLEDGSCRLAGACGADSRTYRSCPMNRCNEFINSLNRTNISQAITSLCNSTTHGCTQPRLCGPCRDYLNSMECHFTTGRLLCNNLTALNSSR